MSQLEDLLSSEVVQAVIEKISRKVTEQVIAEHIRSCPHGQMVARGKAMLIGLCLGSGVAGGGIATLIIREFAKL